MSRRPLDLSTVDSDTAARLLARYLPVARKLGAIYPWIDAATLQATAEDAILEAHLTLDGARANEATWTRRVLYWRLAEAAKRPWDDTAFRFEPDPQTPNGIDPEEAFWRATCVSALGHLTTRQQMIVEGRMKGLTFAELGTQLGISHTVVHREAKKAFQTLRALLEDDGVD